MALVALVSILVVVLTLPAQAGSARTRKPAPGAERFAGGWALPVKTKAPAWYTKRYFHKVMAAGRHGARLPRGASMPAAVGLASAGIRPGQWLVTVTTN